VRSDSSWLDRWPVSWGLRISAPLVAGQALALIVYGILLIVEVARFGITGPEEVSNVPAVVLEIVIFTGFGIALAFTARGLWQARRPARAPAVLAQLIAFVIGGPLAFSTETGPRIAGITIVAVAGVATIALLSRGVTQEMGDATA